MGMRKQEVNDTPAAVYVPSPALPSFNPNPPTAIDQPSLGGLLGARHSLSKEEGMTRGGVAHDAAAITAAMSAMKTDDEVKVLFTSLYRHILSLVSE